MKFMEDLYVRTLNDGIIKVLYVDDKYLRSYDDKSYLLEDLYFVRSSFNLKKLIEVGDYVNGNKVVKINCRFEYIDDDSDYGVSEVEDGIETTEELIYFESDIKSVFTKEEMER